MKVTFVRVRFAHIAKRIVCVLCVLLLIVPASVALAAPSEGAQIITSKDTLRLEDIPGAQASKGTERPNASVVSLSATLELVVEDSQQNAVENAEVSILYGGNAVATGSTGNGGRITFTGLTSAVAFTVSVSHAVAGSASMFYDGAALGFEHSLVLSLPLESPLPPAESVSGMTAGSVSWYIAFVLWVLAALCIARILVDMIFWARARRGGNAIN